MQFDLALSVPAEERKNITIPEMTVRGENVPFQRYKLVEIWHTPGVEGYDKLILMYVHFLDSLTERGCFASNETIGDNFGLTYSQVKNRCAKLKKKKLLVTLGYTDYNLAFRRVQLSHTLNLEISGVRIPNGTYGSYRRKSGEPNPRVILNRGAPPPL